MVFSVLFWNGALTLWMAEPWPDSLKGQTNSPGMATGSGKGLGPVPSQEVLIQCVEEETDHLLGAPRKGASDRETWGLRRGGIVTTSEWLCMHDCWLNAVKVSFTVHGLRRLRGPKTWGLWWPHEAGRMCQPLGDLIPPCEAGPVWEFVPTCQY